MTVINFSILEQVANRYSRREAPFLFELREKMADEKPYKGLRVMHNVPLTLTTIIKIEALLLGGADVTVSSIKTVSPHPEALKILNRAGVKVDLSKVSCGDFDIYSDCCGELAENSPPAYGAVELTRTGAQIYKNIDLTYPVLSVDDSDLKRLETVGTGEDFVRAFHAITQTRLDGKKVVLFGYGKVGKGIVKALKKLTDKIRVVDVNPLVVAKLISNNIKGILLEDLITNKKELSDADCIVTVTGQKDFISTFFNKEDFGRAFLANMGALDEFGPRFSADDVLANKQPLNFILEEPTRLRYLDPIFYAHNIAIDILLSKKVANGFFPFPNDIAFQILEKWAIFHSENIAELLTD